MWVDIVFVWLIKVLKLQFWSGNIILQFKVFLSVPFCSSLFGWAITIQSTSYQSRTWHLYPTHLYNFWGDGTWMSKVSQDFSWKDQCKERREIWGSHAVHSSEDFFPGVEVNIAVSARFKSSQEDCWSWTWLQFVSEWTESDEVIGDGQRCEDIEQQKDLSWFFVLLYIDISL